MNFKKSVFKVRGIRESVSYDKPWQITDRIQGSGTTFALSLDGIITNNSDSKTKSGSGSDYIFITNSHVVENTIHIVMDVNSEVHKCKLMYIIPEYDLAIIQPEKEISNVHPLKIGKSPKQLEKVVIAGFPFGGDNISTTEGIISRIDAVQYYQGLADNIAILIDAAVNFGNSGGPAITKKGEVGGVVFSGKRSAQNMNYIIPNAILKLFVRLYINKFKWDGISYLPLVIRGLQNSTLRKVLKVPDNTNNGVVVTKLRPCNLGIKSTDFQKEDVILAINGHDITSSGKINWNDQLIDFDLYINLLQPGTKINIDIIRNGKPTKISHTLLGKDMLIPKTSLYSPLTYAIIYGLVFLPLSYPLIESYDPKSWSFISNLVKSNDDVYDFEVFDKEMIKYGLQQIIILQEILPDTKNQDYEPLKRKLVSLNGFKVYNLIHMMDIIKATIGKKELLKFDFEDDFIYIDSKDENTLEKFVEYNSALTTKLLGITEFIKI